MRNNADRSVPNGDEDGLPLFSTDMNGGANNWGSSGSDFNHEDNNERTTSIKTSADDIFAQELSQLAIDEVGNLSGGDLHSVVQQISMPFPCQQLLCSTNVDIILCRNDSDHGNYVEASNSGCIICNVIDMRHKNNAIQHYMGCMAQCRGARGEALREAGAIDALLGILWRLIVPMQIVLHDHHGLLSISLLPELISEANTSDCAAIYPWGSTLCNNHLHLQQNNPSRYDEIAINELAMTAIDLAISCLGSLRDLSCGSALNRSAVLEWTPLSLAKHCGVSIENGIHVLSAYVRRYDQIKWEELLSVHMQGHMGNDELATSSTDSTTYTARGKKELRLLTNALGTIRNTSHSTPDVCQEFFNHGLVDVLVWRLMPTYASMKNNLQSTADSIPTSSALPDATKPWREACFRAAGSLINLAEKCPDVAHQLGSNRQLIYLLIETWGGASAITVDPNGGNKKSKGLPLLHLGLAAILHAADSGALEGGLDDVMVQVLEKEKLRKRAAQRREEERKLRLAKGKKK